MRNATRLLTITLLLLPAVATADKGGKGRHGHGKDRAEHGGSGPRVDVAVVFGARERDAARGFFVERHGRGGCPPGLAKKHNGCLPPGQAKKRYTVGRPLPRGIAYEPLPGELRRRLGEPPRGYTYAMLDGDLLKLAVGTLLVVDAVQGLVD